ncbi:LysE family translocator [Litchfieldella rifensis]|uniref:LysE family translocator n=1 Tax=Litchfieldella rifensis TaxID=762643 RepID=A0ABV7LMF1_9GAMM
MELFLIVAGVGVAHLLAVMSPGPSLLVVARAAIATSRVAGVWTAFGIGVGSMIWVLAALFGLTLVFAAAPWVYAGMKVVGAIYLFYLAIQLWRHAKLPMRVDGSEDTPSGAPWKLFCRGLLVQLSNPKVVVFMGSILITLLPPQPSSGLVAALLLVVFLNEFVWFSFVACAFSIPRLRDGYIRFKSVIDRVTGTCLGGLGVRLIASR